MHKDYYDFPLPPSLQKRKETLLELLRGKIDRLSYDLRHGDIELEEMLDELETEVEELLRDSFEPEAERNLIIEKRGMNPHLYPWITN